MKSEKRHWRPSPMVVVLTTATLVVVATMALGWLNARRYRTNARVEIGATAGIIEVSVPYKSANAGILADGEVARMAVRVRDAAGLLMGLAMLAVSEQLNNRNHVNVDSLLGLMATRNLIPPGISQSTANGTLASDRATIYVRYRSQPLGIEVVSIGKERIDGPAIIARLAAGGDDSTGALLFIARKNQDVALPAAFASIAQVAALNWSVEPLRGGSLTTQEIERLGVWAKQYAATNK
jgi:hypothetical protein